MKFSYLVTPGLLLLLSFTSFSQETSIFNLHTLVNNNGLNVFNREISLINEESYLGIRLSKDLGEGIAWIKGVEFSNGIIEFDVRGENIKQHSFVGIAFHGINDSTFDAIYLRPFQFNEEDAVLRSHSIQYISLPNFTWRVLREKSPGEYEHSIDPSPDPYSWVKMRIEIKDATVTTYINDSKVPSLVIQKVTQVKSGLIGFYVADTSGGDFANLRITKTN
jgi:hypothetical protein